MTGQIFHFDMLCIHDIGVMLFSHTTCVVYHGCISDEKCLLYVEQCGRFDTTPHQAHEVRLSLFRQRS